MLCRNCGRQMADEAAFCPYCGVPAGTGFACCPYCGCSTDPQMTVCPHCGKPLSSNTQQHGSPDSGACPPPGGPQPGFQGYPQGGNPYAAPPVYGQKSRLVAGLLGIFVGYLGIHNFYLGYTQKGLIQILVSLVGGFFTCGIATAAIGIWALVEAIMIFTGSISTDANGIPLKD